MRTAISAPMGPAIGLAVRKTSHSRRHHGGLRQQIVSEVVAGEPVHDLDQPPGQRRQLVVTELPFAAICQCLDEIERQIGVEQGRKGRPDDGVEDQNGGQRPPGRRHDPI